MNRDAQRVEVGAATVFINYRGSDQASAAAVLHAELAARLGDHAVFLDRKSIPPGVDFGQVLLDGARQAAVLLAVIGERWLIGEPGQRQIDDPRDWVRREIVEAMAHNVPVVPILVGDAPKLATAALPKELAVLASLQHFEVRPHRQHQDMRAVIDVLTTQLPRLRKPPAPRRGRSQH